MKTGLSAAAAPLLPALLLIAGCAGGIDAPSLAPRPIETAANAPEPTAAPVAPAQVDSAAAGQAAALRAKAEAADRAFADAIVAAEKAPGGNPGSEGWIARQTALSAAVIARNPALDALSDLDALVSKVAADGTDLEAVTVARDAVQALVTAQNEKIARLNS